jgi:hypothetical protein
MTTWKTEAASVLDAAVPWRDDGEVPCAPTHMSGHSDYADGEQKLFETVVDDSFLGADWDASCEPKEFKTGLTAGTVWASGRSYKPGDMLTMPDGTIIRFVSVGEYAEHELISEGHDEE